MHHMDITMGFFGNSPMNKIMVVSTRNEDTHLLVLDVAIQFQVLGRKKYK
jgi:hypothetical protein